LQSLTYDQVIAFVVVLLALLHRGQFHYECTVSSGVAINIYSDHTWCEKDHTFTHTCSLSGWF